MERSYYVYRHIRKDTGKPFYVGVSTKVPNNPKTVERLYARAFSIYGRSKHWSNIYKKAGREVEVIFESDDKKTILNKEIEFIKIHGLLFEGGILCNYARGGQGLFGRAMSQSVKDKISKAQMGSKNHKSKAVINVLTKEFFGTVKEAWESSEKYSYHHFKKMLNGTRTNKTNYQYGAPKKS